MKILVCVKQVVDTSKMEVDPNTGRLNRNGANSILNPCDKNALEAALQLKQQTGGTVTDRLRQALFCWNRCPWGLTMSI